MIFGYRTALTLAKGCPGDIDSWIKVTIAAHAFWDLSANSLIRCLWVQDPYSALDLEKIKVVFDSVCKNRIVV